MAMGNGAVDCNLCKNDTWLNRTTCTDNNDPEFIQTEVRHLLLIFCQIVKRVLCFVILSTTNSLFSMPKRILIIPTTQKVNYTVNPEFNLNYVKKYCTEEEVDLIILYYPIVLLITALVLVAIDKIFVAIFKSGQEKKRLYGFVRPCDGSRVLERQS